MKKKIIIFDLWQTLVNAKQNPSALLEIISYPKKDSDIFYNKLSSSHLFLKDIDVEVGLSKFLLSLNITDTDIIKKSVFTWKNLLESAYMIEGALKLIQDLKIKGYKLCLMSNIDKYAYEYFPFPELVGLFDYQFLSYKESIAKPDLKCWEIIKNRSGYNYSEMIMVGDSAEKDIIPAKKMGVECFMVSSEGDYSEIYKDLITKFNE